MIGATRMVAPITIRTFCARDSMAGVTVGSATGNAQLVPASAIGWSQTVPCGSSYTRSALSLASGHPRQQAAIANRSGQQITLPPGKRNKVLSTAALQLPLELPEINERLVFQLVFAGARVGTPGSAVQALGNQEN